jgi:hypothetical protein
MKDGEPARAELKELDIGRQAGIAAETVCHPDPYALVTHKRVPETNDNGGFHTNSTLR